MKLAEYVNENFINFFEYPYQLTHVLQDVSKFEKLGNYIDEHKLIFKTDPGSSVIIDQFNKEKLTQSNIDNIFEENPDIFSSILLFTDLNMGSIYKHLAAQEQAHFWLLLQNSIRLICVVHACSGNLNEVEEMANIWLQSNSDKDPQAIQQKLLSEFLSGGELCDKVFKLFGNGNLSEMLQHINNILRTGKSQNKDNHTNNQENGILNNLNLNNILSTVMVNGTNNTGGTNNNNSAVCNILNSLVTDKQVNLDGLQGLLS